MPWQPTYREFTNPHLVEIYNTVNPIADYKDFYLNLASRLDVESIIDIGCGSGLLTCELANAGYRMTGVEPSAAMLNLARQSECSESAEWIEGGVEKLRSFGADLAIMTGHVAQFFLDDEGWRAALGLIHRSLGPGGYLAFETRNLEVPAFADWPTVSSHSEVLDPVAGEIEWWYEPLVVGDERVRYDIHYLFGSTGEELVSHCELRFRTEQELRESLESAGFSIQQIFGDWDSSPVEKKSPELIFVAKRE